VHEARLLSMSGAEAVIEIRCGSGTYIRAIARDMGAALGCPAILSSLRRTAYGVFNLGNSCSPADATPDRIIPTVDALVNLKRAVTTGAGELMVRQGRLLDDAFFETAQVQRPAAGERLAITDGAGRLVVVILGLDGAPCLSERVFDER
jgi:tRNA pseudouridine55 synthase